MATPGYFNGIAPGFYVTDLSRATQFYEQKLGFTKTYGNEGYAVLKRDDVSIHLSRDASGKAGKGFATVYVADVAGIHAACADSGVVITRPLEASEYGMNDFVIADVDGNTLLIGEPAE